MTFLDRPARVRHAIGGLALAGGVALALFTVVRRPLVGVGVYLLTMIGVVALQSQATTMVFDERDEAIAKDAAQLTMTVFGWASAGVFPALTAAWGLGYFEWGPGMAAIGLFVAVLYLTYGALVVALQRRR